MATNEICRVLGYEFNDRSLLETALTHKSIHMDKGYSRMDNERLEFIGDALLDAIIGIELYQKLPAATEGELTKKRADIVCERSLAVIAKKINLSSYMHFSHGAFANNVTEKDSVLADCVEAVIGAIYLDSGYEAVKEFILRLMGEVIEDSIQGNLAMDYKSELQEYFQKKKKDINISYIVEKEEGPAHNRMFYIRVEADGIVYGHGSGYSKKSAEMEAAKEGLLFLKKENR
ncbi:MAG: ribonuclease III [Clostridia bacterium]|nr:ribonuclease III [Clostridia bacterium]